MNGTIRDIIFKLRGAIRQSADDSRLSNRFLFSFLKSSRKELISQELNKKRLSKSLEYQQLGCLEIESVNPSSCLGVQLEGLVVYRSKIRIPRIIDTNEGLAIAGIYSIDGSNRFQLTTRNGWLRRQSRKYKTDDVYVFFEDGYLYTEGYNEEGSVRVVALFEDPEEVHKLNETTKNDCGEEASCVDMLDAPFDIPSSIENLMIDRAKGYIFDALKLPRDTANDSKENV